MGCVRRILSVDPCCGCLKLWVAVTMVAGIEIVFSAFSAVLLAVAITTINMYQTDDAFRASDMSTFLNFWNLEREDEDLDEIKQRLWLIFGVVLCLSLINLVIASILLYAVRTRCIPLLRVWIIVKAGGISLCIIYLLTTVFLGQATLVGALLDLTQIGLLLYFFWIVYAFMLELVEEQILRMSPSIIQTQGKIEMSFPL